MLNVGDVIGEYRIDAVLGEGGMGAVYRATQGALGRFSQMKGCPPNRGNFKLVICGHDERSVQGFGAEPIGVPMLRDREGEIEHVIRCYAEDVVASLQTSLRLHAKDRQWVRKHGKTLGEIQRCCERLLALKHFGTYTGAAEWLEIAWQSLTDWMEARDIIGIPS